MPLIVISGLPSSGKSSVVAALADACRAAGQEVQVVDEDSLHLTRNDSYKDAASEKVARGAMLSAIDRCLGRRRTVIFDTQNAIKGYRYQLWCIARQACTRYCVVHVDTPPELCRQWNAARPAEGAYSSPIFDDLAGRFERPDSRNRWDAPLFTVRPQLREAAVQEQLQAAAAAVSDTPLARQRAAAAASGAAAGAAAAAAAANGSGGGGAEGAAAAAAAAAAAGEAPEDDGPAVLPQSKELRPHLAGATAVAPLSSTNLQYEIDRALQQVLDRIAEAQAAAGSSAPGRVTFDGCSCAGGGAAEPLPPLHMDRPMFLPELRRPKRGFMRLTTKQAFQRTGRPAAAQRMFVGYLADQLAAGAWGA